TRPAQLHPHVSRCHQCAPLGIGVKTTPAARVDLRSSLDPDPSPAHALNRPGNTGKTDTRSPAWALDTPRSFRNDSNRPARRRPSVHTATANAHCVVLATRAGMPDCESTSTGEPIRPTQICGSGTAVSIVSTSDES